MRIEAVDIYGFGKWYEQHFDFDPQLQVFQGDNETGKSTLSAFIDGVLFGFATKKQPYAQYIPKSGHSYGGQLTLVQNKQRYIVKRVAGRAGGEVTVTTADGQHHDEAFLQQLLAPINGQLFRQIFRFDQQALTAIFQLQQTDISRQLLTVGAAGSQEWLHLAQKYRREAARLYKPRGRVWPLNQAFNQLTTLKAKLANAQATLPTYLAQQQKVQRQQALVTTLDQQIATTRPTINTLSQLQRSWPNYQNWQALQRKLAQQPASLAPQVYQAFQALQQQHHSQQAELQQLTAKLNAATGEQQLTPAFLFYQQHQAEFTEQMVQVTTMQTALQVSAELRQQQQVLQQEQQQLQTELGVTTAQQPLSQLDLTQARHNQEQRQQLQQQIQQQQAVLQQQTQQNQTAEQQVAQLENQLQSPQSRSQRHGKQQSYLVWGLVLVIGLLLPKWLKLVAVGGVAGLIWQWRQQSVTPTTTATQQQWQQALAKLDQQQARLVGLTQQLNKAKANLAAATAAWESLKGRYNYGSLSDDVILNHQHDFTRLLACQQQQAQLTERQNETTYQLHQWLAGFDFARAWLPLANVEPAAAISQISDFVAAQQTQLTNLRAGDQDYAYYQQQTTRVQQEIAATDQARHDLLTRHHLVSEHELQQRQQADQSQQQLRERQTILANQLGPLLTTLQKYADLASLQTELTTRQNELQQKQTQLDAGQRELTTLQTQLEQLASDGSYRILRQQVAQQEAEITALTQRWLSYQLAAQWIERTLSQTSRQRLPAMLTLAENYFAILTQQRYVKIKLTADQITVMRQDHQVFAVGELSQGTAEQLYVALRLAFAQTISDVQQMPLVIDDSFVNFDSHRQQQVLTLLAKLSQTNQVIYFTAQTVQPTVGQVTVLQAQ
ncbi:ATP-binding protein [Loigolactobacillus binensis]|uniref:AAA family ATPase n=1 Tax=Loigolactobacillus binensis TaxID=2559922 RepID=A0ABW3E7F8_9LACO|nr:AAA family ATPase [Loigolactobacillus binensis]